MNITQKDFARKQAGRQQGVALLLALLFVVLLSAIVVEFAYETQVEASFVESHFSHFEAYVAAKSAVNEGLAALAADLMLPDPNTGPGEVSGALYDSLDEDWAADLSISSINEATMTTTITDEYGKLNLNALILEDEQVNEFLEEALRFLFEDREIEDDPVDAIIDWLDEDDDERPNGAESGYYLSLDIPYACRNGPMNSVEELLLIPGITPEVYFGDPEREQLPLSELFTVHGHPDGVVNANTAPFEVLRALFDVAYGNGEARADEVLRRREEDGPYESVEALEAEGIIEPPEPGAQAGSPQTASRPTTAAAGAESQGHRFLEVYSEVFRIRGDGTAGDARLRVEAYVWRAPSSQNPSVTTTPENTFPELFRILDWRIIR